MEILLFLLKSKEFAEIVECFLLWAIIVVVLGKLGTGHLRSSVRKQCWDPEMIISLYEDVLM